MSKSDAHAKKTIVTKEEFLSINKKAAQNMSADAELQEKAREVFIRGDRHRWLHQGMWFGEPFLNLPQDMFALQEIVWKTRPDFIIEVGVAWGGALLFESMLLEVLGGSKVIGIDIFIPDDLRERLMGHGKLSRRVELIAGSSVAPETLEQVRSILGGSTRTLVVLDSLHTHDHVLRELNLYSPFVGKDHYLICGDTIVEYMPVHEERRRPWGPGNNPATAVKEFLSGNDRFVVDAELEQKLLFSCHPGGYLKAIAEK
jgi:cephalosporin hydroxylase